MIMCNALAYTYPCLIKNGQKCRGKDINVGVLEALKTKHELPFMAKEGKAQNMHRD